MEERTHILRHKNSCYTSKVVTQWGSSLIAVLCIPFGCTLVFSAKDDVEPPVDAAAPTATLLFASNFGPGVTLGPVYDIDDSGNDHEARQDLSGTDEETGFSWPISALDANFSGILSYAVDPITTDTFDDYFTHEIRSVPGPFGKPVNELFQQVKIKAPAGAGGSQAPLLIQRGWTSGDVSDLYISFWFKFQSDLKEQLDYSVSGTGSAWRMVFALRTGGSENTWRGDYRINTSVQEGADGQIYWYTGCDSDAGGPWSGENKELYWEESNDTVPVPIDQWFPLEVYWHRSTGNDGRYWAAANGQIVIDHRGPNMGNAELPITRIALGDPYSGGHAIVETHLTHLQVWDGFPCGEGQSCHNP